MCEYAILCIDISLNTHVSYDSAYILFSRISVVFCLAFLIDIILLFFSNCLRLLDSEI